MIKSIRLQNFFSFRDTTIELNPDVNILVGINGSGKTNFIKAIQLFRQILRGNDLKNTISIWGGIDSIVNGSENSVLGPIIGTTLKYKLYVFGNLEIEYSVILRSSIQFNFKVDEHFIIKSNREGFDSIELRTEDGQVKKYTVNNNPTEFNLADDHLDQQNSNVFKIPHQNTTASVISSILRLWIESYEVFDTSLPSKIRMPSFATAENRLNQDASNLVSVLNFLKGENLQNYNILIQQIQNINPNFIGFDYTFFGGNVELVLQEKNLNRPIRMIHISDGTLRYICFQAIFNNPQRGKVICIDEPETGLHPDMIRGLAKSILEAGKTSQMIISTHSENLLNQFRLENILVFEKDETNATIVNRFTEEQFAGWYKQFNAGEMWANGDIGGNRW